MERRDFFTVVAIGLAAWSAMTIFVRNAETKVIETVIDQVPILPKFDTPQDAFTVRADRSSIVVVCDAQSPQAGKWMASEGRALIDKGWQIKTVDLEGSTELRFYILSGGQWKVHNGHLSLQVLTSLLPRTAPPQPNSMQTGRSSVAEGMR